MENFLNELSELRPGGKQGIGALSGGPIVFSLLSSHDLGMHGQVTRFFKLVKERVERAGTDVVAVPRKLLHHLHAEERFFHSMIEDVQPYESAKDHLGQ
jgi:hypothetical protein